MRAKLYIASAICAVFAGGIAASAQAAQAAQLASPGNGKWVYYSSLSNRQQCLQAAAKLMLQGHDGVQCEKNPKNQKYWLWLWVRFS